MMYMVKSHGDKIVVIRYEPSADNPRLTDYLEYLGTDNEWHKFNGFDIIKDDCLWDPRRNLYSVKKFA